MTKQLKTTTILPPAEIKRTADFYLAEIAGYNAYIDALESEAKAALQDLEAKYIAEMAPVKENLKRCVSWLLAVMKSNKQILFDGTDIVRLANGSLIHSVADKVSIPRDKDAVIAPCEE